MTASFGFAAMTDHVEQWLAAKLGLSRVRLDPTLERAQGTWKQVPVGIRTAAYSGGPIRYARFTRVESEALEIGNILCLSRADQPLPILGADLVAIGGSGLVVVDLSPTVPDGVEGAILAARRARHPDFPSPGPLPAWCEGWMSPHALLARVSVELAPAALRAFRDFPATFLELADTSAARPALAAEIARAQARYVEAHLKDDKGLNLLGKIFGEAWSQRFLKEVLFPSIEALPG